MRHSVTTDGKSSNGAVNIVFRLWEIHPRFCGVWTVYLWAV